MHNLASMKERIKSSKNYSHAFDIQNIMRFAEEESEEHENSITEFLP